MPAGSCTYCKANQSSARAWAGVEVEVQQLGEDADLPPDAVAVQARRLRGGIPAAVLAKPRAEDRRAGCPGAPVPAPARGPAAGRPAGSRPPCRAARPPTTSPHRPGRWFRWPRRGREGTRPAGRRSTVRTVRCALPTTRRQPSRSTPASRASSTFSRVMAAKPSVGDLHELGVEHPAPLQQLPDGTVAGTAGPAGRAVRGRGGRPDAQNHTQLAGPGGGNALRQQVLEPVELAGACRTPGSPGAAAAPSRAGSGPANRWCAGAPAVPAARRRWRRRCSGPASAARRCPGPARPGWRPGCCAGDSRRPAQTRPCRMSPAPPAGRCRRAAAPAAAAALPCPRPVLVPAPGARADPRARTRPSAPTSTAQTGPAAPGRPGVRVPAAPRAPLASAAGWCPRAAGTSWRCPIPAAARTPVRPRRREQSSGRPQGSGCAAGRPGPRRPGTVSK